MPTKQRAAPIAARKAPVVRDLISTTPANLNVFSPSPLTTKTATSPTIASRAPSAARRNHGFMEPPLVAVGHRASPPEDQNISLATHKVARLRAASEDGAPNLIKSRYRRRGIVRQTSGGHLPSPAATCGT